MLTRGLLTRRPTIYRRWNSGEPIKSVTNSVFDASANLIARFTPYDKTAAISSTRCRAARRTFAIGSIANYAALVLIALCCSRLDQRGNLNVNVR